MKHTEREKHAIKLKVRERFLWSLGLVQLLSILAICVSPFLLIWFEWPLALKVAGTGVVGFLLAAWLYSSGKRFLDKLAEDKIADMEARYMKTYKPNTYQGRMEEAIRKGQGKENLN